MSAAVDTVDVGELGETCEICLGDIAKSDLVNRPCNGEIFDVSYRNIALMTFLTNHVLRSSSSDQPRVQVQFLHQLLDRSTFLVQGRL